VITYVEWPTEITWDGVVPKPDTVAVVAAALATGEQWTLLPGPVPEELSPGSAFEAGFHTERSVPTNVWRAEVYVTTSDDRPLISVGSGWATDSPDCSARIERGWKVFEVRDASGCGRASNVAVGFLEWTEADRRFHASFPAGRTLREMAAWLEGWWPAGDCGSCRDAAPGT
jgi:hypothetical protein